MKKKNHPFHLVNKSPWPILTSFSVFSFMLGLIKWFYLYNSNLLIFSAFSTTFVSFMWWRDIIRESTFQGHHSFKVTKGLRWGMMLFITSEIFFFLAFFWAFFHSSLSPSVELGMNWPPKGIKPFNPLEIPLLNTLILLSSGLTITWSHHSIMENNYSQSLQSLLITVLLGFYFTTLQIYEYKEAPFSISDGIYGSTFFMTTGLHGLHVIIGSIFLFICLIRMYFNHFSSNHHFGFEAAAWYWHFVDVIWLFLYVSMYWWSS
uniref:cytochrome c oxidase subunit III n=1 Tax=Sternochetus olivieri TaxID=2302647 RepID=UPI002237D6E2|nr:cytochrome c oxidase subunit III [Sternochetus olivieri]UYP50718.1 cytochrome c oxidase subunit III [Sternochetus olivieri]